MFAPALSFLLVATLAAPVAHARDERVVVRVEAQPLGSAIVALGRQTGTSIGVRDPALARLRVRGVSGRLRPEQALARILRDTGALARKVAPGTFLIERVRPVRAKPAVPPPAPPASEPVVEDIVVVASKRDVPLAEFPGVAAVTFGNELSIADGTRGTEAIVSGTASLNSTYLGPGRNKLFIRGVADSSFTGPTQATVGQYWGDTRLTYSAPDPDLRLYDVARVEVLEGPQGTLYGAGSLGGIVRVVPQAVEVGQTSAAGWGGVLLTQHGDAGGDGGAMINLPVAGDSVAIRALAYGALDGGYIDDRLRGLDDVNRVETYGARGGIGVEPGGGWRIDLSGTWQRIEGRDAQYSGSDDGDLSRNSAVAQPFVNDFLLGELRIARDWGDIQLRSSTGIVDHHVSETFDATSPQGPPARFGQSSEIRMLTSETRLARRSRDGSGWVVGASFLHNDARLTRSFGQVAMTAMPAPGVRNRISEATLFGEATVVPLEWLSLTGGGRLTHSRLSGDAEDVARMVAFRNDPAGGASRHETRFLPSAAVLVQPDERFTLFARYQQGFRPGGLAVRRDLIERFVGDRVATVEAGLRIGAPARDRFDVLLVAAHTDWRDIQADLIDGIGFPVTANIGDGTITSIGLSAAWRPGAGFELSGSLYWNDSEVTAPSVALLSAVAATQGRIGAAGPLPNVADFNGRIGLRHATQLGRGESLRLSGYARYVGESRLGIGPVLGHAQGDWLDTGLEARAGNERRGISLAITNLFDARGNRFALGSPFQVAEGDQITPMRPRSLRIGVDWRF